jgi:hypothetical protein
MTKPRVLLEGWKHQCERMRRSRVRLDSLSTYPESDDAFFHAVQDAWHLKDWIQNDESDPSIDQSLRAKIVAVAHRRDAILIIADLANCTKHLVQRDPPRQAQNYRAPRRKPPTWAADGRSAGSGYALRLVLCAKVPS